MDQKVCVQLHQNKAYLWLIYLGVWVLHLTFWPVPLLLTFSSRSYRVSWGISKALPLNMFLTQTNKTIDRVPVCLFCYKVVCPLARAESFLYTFSPRLSWSAVFLVPLAPPDSLSTSHLFFTLFPCVYHPEVLNWITVWQHCKQNSCRRWLWRLSEP